MVMLALILSPLLLSANLYAADPIEIVGADAESQEAYARFAEVEALDPQVFRFGRERVLVGRDTAGLIPYYDLARAGERGKYFGLLRNRPGLRHLVLLDYGQHLRGDISRLKRRWAERVFALNGRLFVISYYENPPKARYLDELVFAVGLPYPFEPGIVKHPAHLLILPATATVMAISGIFADPGFFTVGALALYALGGLDAYNKEQQKLSIGVRPIAVGNERSSYRILYVVEDEFGIVSDVALRMPDLKRTSLVEWMDLNPCPYALTE